MKSPKIGKTKNLPEPQLGFRPFSPSTPAQRGDNGKGPLPREVDGRTPRHVNLDRKTGFGAR